MAQQPSLENRFTESQIRRMVRMYRSVQLMAKAAGCTIEAFKKYCSRHEISIPLDKIRAYDHSKGAGWMTRPREKATL